MLSNVNASSLYYGPHSELDHKILFEPLVKEIASLNLQSLYRKELNFDQHRLQQLSGDQSKDQHTESLVPVDTVGCSKLTGIEKEECIAELEHEDHIDLDVCFVLFLMMIVGGIMKDVAAYIKLPYTSLITVLGLGLGILDELNPEMLGGIGKAVNVYSEIPPHFLLLVFLPALIFESAFNSDWHIFKAQLGQILILAGPMLLIGTYLSALMMYYMFEYNDSKGFSFNAALMYGSIISATDPVAVVSLLNTLGASKRITTMIEGESLLNDGTAMVLFLILLQVVEAVEPMTSTDMFMKFLRLSGGGVILGLFGGWVMATVISRIKYNQVLEINATVAISYMIFYLAEYTPLHVSGIISIVVMGLYMTNIGKTKISSGSAHAVHHVWSYIGFVAETVIFMVSGIIMGEKAAESNEIGYEDYMKLLGIYVVLHFIRFFCILLFWPCLRKMGYGMTFKQVVLATYAGLRGAVGLSLALMVQTSPHIDQFVKDLVLLDVAGVALLTLVINASTTEWLVKKLGLTAQSEIQQNILLTLIANTNKNLIDNIDNIKGQNIDEHSLVDWKAVQKSVDMSDLGQNIKKVELAEERMKTQQSTNDAPGAAPGLQKRRTSLKGELDQMNDRSGSLATGVESLLKPLDNELITELRHKFIFILKSLYWQTFQDSNCYGSSVIALNESADVALDLQDQPLDDWNYLRKNFVGNSAQYFALSKLPVLSYFFANSFYQQQLQAYDVLINYIEAHRKAQAMIVTIISQDDLKNIILDESKRNLNEAVNYIDSKFDNLVPGILRTIQNQRVEFKLLNGQLSYIEHQNEQGLIEETDFATIQTEIRRKINLLQKRTPEITQLDVQDKLNSSVLGTIFTEAEMAEAFKSVVFQRTEYEGGRTIGHSVHKDKIIYIDRGQCDENKGDNEENALKRGQGQLVCIQNLMPNYQTYENINLFTSSHAIQVFVLDAKYLRNIIASDTTRLKTLWRHFGYHLVKLNPTEFKETNSLTQKEIKKLISELSEIEICYEGQEIIIASFCFVLQGSIVDEEGNEYEGPQFVSLDRTSTYVAKLGPDKSECVLAYMDDQIEVKLEKQQKNGKDVIIKSKYIDQISKSKVSSGQVDKAESGLARKKTYMGADMDAKTRGASHQSFKRAGTIKQKSKAIDDDLM